MRPVGPILAWRVSLFKKQKEDGNMKTAIMGFGNPVRSDDAIGIYVIEELRKSVENVDDVSLFDMGTAAFEVLFGLKGHDKIILVDAVINTNEPIGTLFKVPAEEVLRAPQEDPMVFLHGMKWDQALSYAKKIMGDAYPEDISVYLIAIDNTKLEVDLSRTVKEAGDKVVNHIIDELKALKVS
ncbi:MAG: hydrogenase maturation protease [Bacteroidota bacterium]